jgi:transposase
MHQRPTINPAVLPELPPAGVTAGVDWSEGEHVVAVVDGAGRTVDRFAVVSTAAGLGELEARLRRNEVAEVAIERGDGPVVAALQAAGLTVVVIAPNQVKYLRSRYGQAGNKDDRFDAFVLADTLRTDRARLRPLIPDSDATIALRAACRARKDLVGHRVALTNQLRAHLCAFYPAPIGLFTDLDGVTSLKFLTRFDCQDRLDWLSPTRLRAWLASVGYSGRIDAETLFARLEQAPRGAGGVHGTAAAVITHALVAAIEAIAGQIRALSEQISDQLANHPDGPIFTSLPRTRRCAPPDCCPRSATAAPASPPRSRWPAWPESHPRPAAPGR